MKSSRSGFTLIEILAATMIFSLAILALVQTRTVSLRNAFESETFFRATQLAARKTAEMELLYQNQIDKDGLRSSFGEKKGSFEAPFETFTWTASLKESPVQITREGMLELLQSFGLEEDEADGQFEQSRLLITNLNKTLKENFAELRVEIAWEQFGRKQNLPVVTHLIPKKPKIQLTTTAEDAE
jgi:prepilin-type N-terminal cleavage/methylation domain-containing protein